MTTPTAPPHDPPSSPPPSSPSPSPPPSRSPQGGRGPLAFAGRVVVAVVALALVVGVTWGIARVGGSDDGRRVSEPRPGAGSIEPADVRPGSAVPAGVTIQPGQQPTAPSPQGTTGGDAMLSWATRVGAAIEVPARALVAYGNADVTLRGETPGCNMTWATLAGVGRIESDHGRYGGARLGDDGLPSRPIIGIPLDGSAGVAAIGDTDDGALDGDTAWDRAVGPMQFIPSTWARFGSDGDGDGRADPHDLDDAALSAGRYLCAGGRDIATADGWWAAVFSYNRSVEYGQKVFGVADGYARRGGA